MPSIHIPRPWRLPERLATPEPVFLDRRQVVASLGLGALTMALPWSAGCAERGGGAAAGGEAAARPSRRPPPHDRRPPPRARR